MCTCECVLRMSGGVCGYTPALFRKQPSRPHPECQEESPRSPSSSVHVRYFYRGAQGAEAPPRATAQLENHSGGSSDASSPSLRKAIPCGVAELM